MSSIGGLGPDFPKYGPALPSTKPKWDRLFSLAGVATPLFIVRLPHPSIQSALQLLVRVILCSWSPQLPIGQDLIEDPAWLDETRHRLFLYFVAGLHQEDGVLAESISLSYEQILKYSPGAQWMARTTSSGIPFPEHLRDIPLAFLLTRKLTSHTVIEHIASAEQKAHLRIFLEDALEDGRLRMERARRMDSTYGRDIGFAIMARLAGHTLPTSIDPSVLDYVMEMEPGIDALDPHSTVPTIGDHINLRSMVFQQGLRAKSRAFGAVEKAAPAGTYLLLEALATLNNGPPNAQERDPCPDPRLPARTVSDPIVRAFLAKYVVQDALSSSGHLRPTLIRLSHVLGHTQYVTLSPGTIMLLHNTLSEGLDRICHQLIFQHLLNYASALCRTMGDLLDAALWIRDSAMLAFSHEAAARHLASFAQGGVQVAERTFYMIREVDFLLLTRHDHQVVTLMNNLDDTRLRRGRTADEAEWLRTLWANDPFVGARLATSAAPRHPARPALMGTPGDDDDDDRSPRMLSAAHAQRAGKNRSQHQQPGKTRKPAPGPRRPAQPEGVHSMRPPPAHGRMLCPAMPARGIMLDRRPPYGAPSNDTAGRAAGSLKSVQHHPPQARPTHPSSVKVPQRPAGAGDSTRAAWILAPKPIALGRSTTGTVIESITDLTSSSHEEIKDGAQVTCRKKVRQRVTRKVKTSRSHDIRPGDHVGPLNAGRHATLARSPGQKSKTGTEQWPASSGSGAHQH
ncbi:hypothetical protein H696_05089 [Fonticula alba]|uniref:Uncharacterized protein n=1 Tax=Fonticula alba TaxID=691883 RepID=A0A058Z1Z9_FONAL|nr:hypothetical protein H696_05089 [Fonticula alba]KCV68161.1 hypothetical protein H696_05089 [Fonticula alba]|eukprot:XP_009497215.1 hypothetical protein H696_05089 [Fonticula alba]